MRPSFGISVELINMKKIFLLIVFVAQHSFGLVELSFHLGAGPKPSDFNSSIKQADSNASDVSAPFMGGFDGAFVFPVIPIKAGLRADILNALGEYQTLPWN